MHANSTTGMEDAYTRVMQDPRRSIGTVYTSELGIVLSSVCSSFSVIASLLMITVILRSSKVLKSVYHRVMFGVGISCIVQSLAMALATLSLPPPPGYDETESDPVSWMIYDQFGGITPAGTWNTCHAQGFCHVFGTLAQTTYISFLCIYYLSSIVFRIKDEKFSRTVEPLMHCVTIGSSLTVAILSVKLDVIKPMPFRSFCSAGGYPWWCGDTDLDIDCLYNDNTHKAMQQRRRLKKLASFVFALTAFTAFFALMIVVLTVYARELLYRNDSNRHGVSITQHGDDPDQQQGVGSGNNSRIREKIKIRTHHDDLKYTKAVMKQSALYVGTTAIAYCTLGIRAAADLTEDIDTNALTKFVTTNRIFQFVDIILRPSQGCTNLVIFLYFMVCNVRRKKNADVELSKVLKLICLGNKEEQVSEYHVSGLEILKLDKRLEKMRNEFQNPIEEEVIDQNMEIIEDLEEVKLDDEENDQGNDHLDHCHDVRRTGDVKFSSSSIFGDVRRTDDVKFSSSSIFGDSILLLSFGGSSQSKLSAYFGSAGNDLVSFGTNPHSNIDNIVSEHDNSKVSLDSASIYST